MRYVKPTKQIRQQLEDEETEHDIIGFVALSHDIIGFVALSDEVDASDLNSFDFALKDFGLEMVILNEDISDYTYFKIELRANKKKKEEEVDVLRRIRVRKNETCETNKTNATST